MDNQNNNPAGAAGQEKTFTQEDVNRIVQERLAKERGRGSEELDKRTAELDLRERKLNAVTELRKNGLPDYLADALNLSSDDAYTASMEAVLRMKKESETEPKGKPIGIGNPIGAVGGTGGYDPLRQVFGL